VCADCVVHERDTLADESTSLAKKVRGHWTLARSLCHFQPFPYEHATHKPNFSATNFSCQKDFCLGVRQVDLLRPTLR
jgi:hypothetical protein